MSAPDPPLIQIRLIPSDSVGFHHIGANHGMNLARATEIIRRIPTDSGGIRRIPFSIRRIFAGFRQIPSDLECVSAEILGPDDQSGGFRRIPADRRSGSWEVHCDSADSGGIRRIPRDAAVQAFQSGGFSSDFQRIFVGIRRMPFPIRRIPADCPPKSDGGITDPADSGGFRRIPAGRRSVPHWIRRIPADIRRISGGFRRIANSPWSNPAKSGPPDRIPDGCPLDPCAIRRIPADSGGCPPDAISNPADSGGYPADSGGLPIHSGPTPAAIRFSDRISWT